MGELPSWGFIEKWKDLYKYIVLLCKTSFHPQWKDLKRTFHGGGSFHCLWKDLLPNEIRELGGF